MDFDMEESPRSSSPAESMLSLSDAASASARKRKEALELPLPADALPPRKRAKTAVEKEQRRVQRILRNRQAAQSSREKKRKQMEELEVVNETLVSENKFAQSRLAQVETENASLRSRLDDMAVKLEQMQKFVNSFNQGSPRPKVELDPVPSPQIKAEYTDTIPIEALIPTETYLTPSIVAGSRDLLDDSSIDAPNCPSFLLTKPSTLAMSENIMTTFTTISDAQAESAFKSMHHPAAVMLLDLQRRYLLVLITCLVPWMVRMVVMSTILPKITSHLFLTWQLRRRSSQIHQSVAKKISRASHFSTSTRLQSRLLQQLSHIRRFKHQFQHQLLRSRVHLQDKDIRSALQLSLRSSIFRHMALAYSSLGDRVLADATGQEQQWKQPVRLIDPFFAVSSSSLVSLFGELFGKDETGQMIEDVQGLYGLVRTANGLVGNNSKLINTFYG
ncbi:hypothetical protein V1514DRAFT_337635 [Lipomyces japonicus]|uniref:uncharacterized protein n=1 Tax=Lipomyces japonicus TaxID=56871 RepID=UPI0034CD4F0A